MAAVEVVELLQEAERQTMAASHAAKAERLAEAACRYESSARLFKQVRPVLHWTCCCCCCCA